MIKFINEYDAGYTVRTVAEFNSNDYKTMDEFEVAYKNKLIELNAKGPNQFRESSKCCKKWALQKICEKNNEVVIPENIKDKEFGDDFPVYDKETNTIRINNFTDRDALVQECAASLSLAIEVLEEGKGLEFIKDLMRPTISLLCLLQVTH